MNTFHLSFGIEKQVWYDANPKQTAFTSNELELLSGIYFERNQNNEPILIHGCFLNGLRTASKQAWSSKVICELLPNFEDQNVFKQTKLIRQMWKVQVNASESVSLDGCYKEFEDQSISQCSFR